MSGSDRLFAANDARLVGQVLSSTIYHARLDVFALWRKIWLHDEGDKRTTTAATPVPRMTGLTRGTHT